MSGRDSQGGPGDSLVSQTGSRAPGAGPTEQRALAAPVSRQAALANSAGKSEARQVTGRLRTALEAMVWRGLAYEQAGIAAGLTARHMRRALEKPHVLAFLNSQKK